MSLLPQMHMEALAAMLKVDELLGRFHETSYGSLLPEYVEPTAEEMRGAIEDARAKCKLAGVPDPYRKRKARAP